MARPIARQLYIKLLKRFRKSPKQQHAVSAAKSLGANIVVIGGGTGLSTMLRGLKEYSQNLTAIVTVADDGGGSGVLRQDLGMLPPGDIRNCITALANTEPTMQQLLGYRFTEGVLEGQSFGNLFLAALTGICGSFEQAVMKMNEVLSVTGRVLPVTTEDVHLQAEFEDGSVVLGESKIFAHKKEHDCRIRKVSLVPEKPAALPLALEAIAEADLIVLGPGSLYTSIIPNLLVKDISEAVLKAQGLKLYVLNIMTQEGETEGYTAFDHAKELMKHSGKGIFDACIYNSQPVKDEFIEKYAREDASPVAVDAQMFDRFGLRLIGKPLISDHSAYARHDEKRLAAAILEIFTEIRPRDGVFGEFDRLILAEKEKE